MIRLDAKCEFPRGRTGPGTGREWKHVPLEGWAREHRAELARACLILCRWWVQAGMPPAPLTGFGSYEQYQQVVGGVLACAGVDGFLGNLDELDELDETDERDQLAGLFSAWLDAYGSEPKLAVEVVRDGRLVEQLAELGLRPDDSVAVGTWLGLHRERVADGKRLERARRGNRNAWRVVPFAPSSHP
jgi:putative DNA primase/helicase